MVKWKTRDGREIPIKEMGTDHLKNCVAMLRRKGFVTPEEYFSCLAYAFSSNTPDGAAMAVLETTITENERVLTNLKLCDIVTGKYLEIVDNAGEADTIYLMQYIDEASRKFLRNESV